MRVKELIEYLNNQDPEALVVMSNDAEGNNYEKLRNMDYCYYVEDSVGNGAIYDSVTDIEDDLGEKIDYVRSVVFWP